MKECGILFPISVLPNKYGIGSFGKCAYDLIDFLIDTKQKYLQILPLGQTGYGDSPYQTFSFYAGSIYYIDLEILVEDGLLCYDDLIENNTLTINYEFLYNTRSLILKKAFSKFVINEEYLEFVQNKWIDDYALFMSLKEVFNCTWYDLPKNYKYREKESLNEFIDNNKYLINYYKFTQYLFCKQWILLKEYANKNNIKIIGDMPIYASYDSCDVWSNPSNFLLDNKLNLEFVSGCSSDEYCSDGQYWGNPLYDWEYLKENKFDLFVNRFNHNLMMYDKVRIDHFRGFASYYKIKVNDNPINGVWCSAYGKELFNELKLNKDNIIIEDLGYITQDVIRLVKHTKFNSMRVAVFGTNKDSIHLPSNYSSNSIAYSTTHDNMPINGWYKYLVNDEKLFIDKYYNSDKCFSIIKHLYKSKASVVIISIFDLLSLSEEYTLNKPNTLNNWITRLDDSYLDNKIKENLIKLVIKYNR